MTGLVDLEAMKTLIFFQDAVPDDRFVWQEIDPDPEIAEIVEITGADMGMNARITRTEWADSLLRYRIVGCTHQEIYRDGTRCSFCGGDNPYEPPEDEAARKNEGK